MTDFSEGDLSSKSIGGEKVVNLIRDRQTLLKENLNKNINGDFDRSGKSGELIMCPTSLAFCFRAISCKLRKSRMGTVIF